MNRNDDNNNYNTNVVGCNDSITAEEQALLDEIERSTDQLNKQVEGVLHVLLYLLVNNSYIMLYTTLALSATSIIVITTTQSHHYHHHPHHNYYYHHHHY